MNYFYHIGSVVLHSDRRCDSVGRNEDNSINSILFPEDATIHVVGEDDVYEKE